MTTWKYLVTINNSCENRVSDTNTQWYPAVLFLNIKFFFFLLFSVPPLEQTGWRYWARVHFIAMLTPAGSIRLVLVYISPVVVQFPLSRSIIMIIEDDPRCLWNQLRYYRRSFEYVIYILMAYDYIRLSLLRYAILCWIVPKQYFMIRTRKISMKIFHKKGYPMQTMLTPAGSTKLRFAYTSLIIVCSISSKQFYYYDDRRWPRLSLKSASSFLKAFWRWYIGLWLDEIVVTQVCYSVLDFFKAILYDTDTKIYEYEQKRLVHADNVHSCMQY